MVLIAVNHNIECNLKTTCNILLYRFPKLLFVLLNHQIAEEVDYVAAEYMTEWQKLGGSINVTSIMLCLWICWMQINRTDVSFIAAAEHCKSN